MNSSNHHPLYTSRAGSGPAPTAGAHGMGSNGSSKDSSAPIVYINPRPPPAPAQAQFSIYSPKSSSHGHGASLGSGTSSSLHHHTSSASLSGIGMPIGGRDSPPGTPLSPRPCVSRKISARGLNSASSSSSHPIMHAAGATTPTTNSTPVLNNGTTNAVTTSTTDTSSSASHQTAPVGVSRNVGRQHAHQRSLSSAVSMTSFPMVTDRDVMNTFGTAASLSRSAIAAAGFQTAGTGVPAAAASSTSPPTGLFGHSQAVSLNDHHHSSAGLINNSRSVILNNGLANKIVDSPSPSADQGLQAQGLRATKDFNPSSDSRSVATFGHAARGAKARASAGIAWSESHHDQSRSANHAGGGGHVTPTKRCGGAASPGSGSGSPSNKKITFANQYAATQELKEWGSNFWVVISDANSGHSFFANPHTGECKWEVPSGTFVLPPNPDGQWMEFFDETHGLPYFAHSQSQRCQWERPPGFVIPLTAIQEVNMGRAFQGPAGVKRNARVSISSDASHSSAGDVGDLSLASLSTSVMSGNHPGQGATSVSFAEPSKAEKRRSIQPPPPTQEPSIDQVLAYRRSLHLGKNELVANALASNAVGVGAPHSSPDPTPAAVASAGYGATATTAEATSRSRSGSRSRDEMKGGIAAPGRKSSASNAALNQLQEIVAATMLTTARPSTAGATTSTPAFSSPSQPMPTSASAPTFLPAGPSSSNAPTQVTIRKTLGPRLLSDEMEHMRDLDVLEKSPFSGPTQTGTAGVHQSRDSMSSMTTTGTRPDDSASVSSAGTEFKMHLQSGRLFGSAGGHSKTGSAGSNGTFTVSGPGASQVNGGAGAESPGTGTGSIRDSVASVSTYSRSSSAMGGFAPIAEENGTGITVKITRPSTSTDGASLASKSGRWTPEFGGSVSSWRRDVLGGGADPASHGGNTGGASGSSGRTTPTLRERESLRNMRSPPTSARAANAMGGGVGGSSGGGAAAQGLSAVPNSPSSGSDLLAPPPPAGLVLPQSNVNGNALSDISDLSGLSGRSVVGLPPRAGSLPQQQQQQQQGAGWENGSSSQGSANGLSSGWRTSSNASAATANLSNSHMSGRTASSAVSPASSQSLLYKGSASTTGYSGRLGGNSLNGTSTPASSFYNNDDSKLISPSRDSSSQGHGPPVTSVSPQPLKSPKLFNALRFKLRSGSNASTSSHTHGGKDNSNRAETSRSFELLGVMNIADRSTAKEVDAQLPPETPEEAYNRRRRMAQAGSPPSSAGGATGPFPPSTPASGSGSGFGGSFGRMTRRNGSLDAGQSQTQAQMPSSYSTSAMARSPATTATPGLAFSPSSVTSTSIGSDSSHHQQQQQPGFGALSEPSAAMPGSYGLGVGLVERGAVATGVAELDKKQAPQPQSTFRPSGVTDVVLNSRHGQPRQPHTSHGSSGAETDDSFLASLPSASRSKDPEARAFDAMLKGYASTESQVLKGVVGRVRAASSSTPSSPTGSRFGASPSPSGRRMW